MAVTTYLANKLLEHMTGEAAFAMPTVWVGLYTADPTNAGTQTNEMTYVGYSRVATSASTWGTAASRAITNIAAITFGTKTGGTDQTATHWATFDAASAGNMLSFGPLTTPQLVANSNVPTIPAGNATQSFS